MKSRIGKSGLASAIIRFSLILYETHVHKMFGLWTKDVLYQYGLY